MFHDAWMLTAITQTAKEGMIVGAPLLATLLTAGIVVGFVQVASQLNDMSVGFIPKAILFVLVLFLFGGWLTASYVQYLHRFYKEIPQWVRYR